MDSVKILIVEDELLIGENLAAKLKKLGYEVTDIVPSGKAAINSVNSNTPNLILMDISLKGEIDGITTVSKIRENHDLPIIFLTAYADEQTLERAANVGSYGYLIKPCKEKELQATIKVALNKHQEQVNIQQSLNNTISEYSIIQNSLQATIAEYSEKNNSIHVDSLTKLPNQLFLQDLCEYLLTIESNSNQPTNQKLKTEPKLLTIFYFSLDRFQRLYDSLGKDHGDILIQKTAEILTECSQNLPQGIESGIIRIQNSEFAIVLSKINDKQIAFKLTYSILERLKQPLVINNQEIFVTASIGVSFYESPTQDVDTLLKQAKRAMIYAEQQGGNTYKVYTVTMDMMLNNSAEEISLETELHYALKRQELELYYLPNVSLQTGKVIGAEALIRWNHPKLGLVSPSRFIPIAESSSLIVPIGEWILKTACQQTKRWHQAGFNFLTISVNLSGNQFKQLDIFHRLTQVLFNSKLEPKFLELDLTEKILVENVKVNIQRLNLIKKIGISISLDDFGTGYCSLGYLQQFPFDTLKIDQCFVRNIDKNRKNAVITQSIIEMAHELGLKVIAEGIETEAELDFLLQHKCDEAQGYLFSRPLPAKEFEQLLMKRQSLIKEKL